MAERRPRLKAERIELLDQDRVLTNLRERGSRDRQLRLLNDEAQRRGGRLIDRPENVFGYRHTFESTGPISPPPGQAGRHVDTAEFELLLEEYGNHHSDSDDQLAVGIATIRAGDNDASYPLLLQAQGRNFVQADEFTVVGDNIVPMESWWTALTGCLSRNCASVCLSSLLACAGTWVAYLGCVAWNCGGCFVGCAACATCSCTWWCSWATGCCSQ